MASETKKLSWIQSFLTEISKWSLMGGHHLVLLSHPEFDKAQCFDLSCSWYTSMTCPREFPLQYDFLLMIFYCTESYETNRMQLHYRQILIIYRNRKENGKWFLTRAAVIHRTLKYSRYGRWQTSISHRKLHFRKVRILSRICYCP